MLFLKERTYVRFDISVGEKKMRLVCACDGIYTTAKIYGGKDYGGYVSSKGRNGVSYVFFISFGEQYHNKRAAFNNKIIERSLKRNVIIKMEIFYAGPTACSEGLVQLVNVVYLYPSCFKIPFFGDLSFERIHFHISGISCHTYPFRESNS